MKDVLIYIYGAANLFNLGLLDNYGANQLNSSPKTFPSREGYSLINNKQSYIRFLICDNIDLIIFMISVTYIRLLYITVVVIIIQFIILLLLLLLLLLLSLLLLSILILIFY